jgi:PAS domain S-box-containing protein
MSIALPMAIGACLAMPLIHLRPMLRWLAILLTGLGMGAWGATQPTLHTDPNYLIQSWETEDGLPEDSATAIVQTPDGYIWFGTFEGLVRFNGIEFTVFNPANTPQLPSAGIVNLHLGKDGRLWISTYGGLVVRDGTQWRQLTRIDPNSNDYARTFTERPNGDLLITTYSGKLFEISDGQFRELPQPPGAKGEGYLGGVDEDGHWWVAQRRFIGRWENQRWVSMIPPPQDIGTVLGFAPARDGGMWLVLGNELRMLRRGAEVTHMTLSESPGGIWSLSEDSQGNVWIATFDKGVCRVATNGTMTRWSATSGGFDHCRCVFEDRERDLWIGTSGAGLQRFVLRRFKEFDLEHGRKGLGVQSLWPDSSGGLWAGTDGRGLFHFGEAGVTNVALPAEVIGPEYVMSVLADRADRLWVGTMYDSIWILEKGRTRHMLPTVIGGDKVHAEFEDSHGRIWVSGGTGIAVFDGDRSRGFGTEQGLPASTVACFAEDSTGAIWLSNGNGVFRTDGEHYLVEVRDAVSRPIRGIGCLKGDSDGTIWLGASDRGLMRWKNGKLTILEAQSGFPVAAVYGLIEDNDGFFWMTSVRSVVRARRSDLRAMADGRVTRVPFQVFDASDGLPVGEFAKGRQPTCALDSKGRLWFATARGVAMTEPAALRLNDTPPPVYVEGISFYRSVPPTNHTVAGNRREEVLTNLRGPFVSPVSLPAGSRRIEVHYAGLSFVAPEKVHYQIRLEGQDENWQDAGNRRMAYYYDLSPRDYVFHVRAANNDGVWNETQATLALAVLPFYWQTTWFRVLGGLLLVGSGGGVVWSLVRARLRRALERERLAMELHESQQRGKLAAEAAGLGMWEWDIARDQIWATDSAQQLFGFAKSEWITFKRLANSVHPDDRATMEREVSRTLQDRVDYAGEFRVVLPDGTMRWIASRGQVELSGNGKPVLLRGASVDITKRKGAEQEMREKQRELEHLSRATLLGELGGSLAHELNQPLTAMVNNAAAGRRFIAKGRADLAKLDSLLQEVTADGRRAGEILSGIRAMIRKGDEEHRPVDLNVAAGEILRLVGSDALSRQCAVVTEFDPDLGLVSGNKVQLQQVFLNLILNALDAMDERPPETRRVLVRTERQADGRVRASVRDFGGGLPHDGLEQVFKPFFSMKRNGMGLGLAIARSIIEAHGGSIAAANAEGGGACFSFWLPAFPEDAAAETARTQREGDPKV